MATEPEILVLWFKGAIFLSASWRQEPVTKEMLCEDIIPVLAKRRWRKDQVDRPVSLQPCMQLHKQSSLKSGGGESSSWPMSYWEVGKVGWWEPLEWGLTSADKNLNGNQVPKEQVETAAPGGKGDGFTLARSTPDAVRVMGSRAGFGSPAGNEGNMRCKVTEITLAHMNSGPEEKERKRWGASIRQSKERAESTMHGERFVKTREVGRWEKMPGKGKEQREGKRLKRNMSVT